jgi:hypothetical protein
MPQRTGNTYPNLETFPTLRTQSIPIFGYQNISYNRIADLGMIRVPL